MSRPVPLTILRRGGRHHREVALHPYAYLHPRDLRDGRPHLRCRARRGGRHRPCPGVGLPCRGHPNASPDHRGGHLARRAWYQGPAAGPARSGRQTARRCRQPGTYLRDGPPGYRGGLGPRPGSQCRGDLREATHRPLEPRPAHAPGAGWAYRSTVTGGVGTRVAGVSACPSWVTTPHPGRSQPDRSRRGRRRAPSRPEPGPHCRGPPGPHRRDRLGRARPRPRLRKQPERAELDLGRLGQARPLHATGPQPEGPPQPPLDRLREPGGPGPRSRAQSWRRRHRGSWAWPPSG